jgi:hypothetical protein
MPDAIHRTENLKFAAALSACGAKIIDADSILVDGKPKAFFILEDQGIGITCGEAAPLWAGRLADLEAAVNEIIARVGLTPEEYALLQLEASRAALNNRGVLLGAAMSRKPLVSRNIGGRILLYRRGTPPETIREILRTH